MLLTTRTVYSLASLVMALASAPAALACREIVPPADELAMHAAPVIATVKTAERVDNPGWNTWKISADDIAATPGVSAPDTFEFLSTLSSDGCGQTSLPPVGEKWVLYFGRGGSLKVRQAYPLEYVRQYDSRLADIR